jgi:hypothetical protein
LFKAKNRSSVYSQKGVIGTRFTLLLEVPQNFLMYTNQQLWQHREDKCRQSHVVSSKGDGARSLKSKLLGGESFRGSLLSGDQHTHVKKLPKAGQGHQKEAARIALSVHGGWE